DRGVQCRSQPIPGIKRSRRPSLKVEDRLQPQLAEQNITRGEPMIKRARRCVEPLGNRSNGHGERAALRGDRQRRSLEVRLVEFRATHRSRIDILDAYVYI